MLRKCSPKVNRKRNKRLMKDGTLSALCKLCFCTCMFLLDLFLFGNSTVIKTSNFQEFGLFRRCLKGQFETNVL